MNAESIWIDIRLMLKVSRNLSVFIGGWDWGGVAKLKQFYFLVAKGTFPSLTGTLALSYFIHNAILSILKNQRDPQNNVRIFNFLPRRLIIDFFLGTRFELCLRLGRGNVQYCRRFIFYQFSDG